MRYSLLLVLLLAGCSMDNVQYPEAYETAKETCASLGGLDTRVYVEHLYNTTYKVEARCKDRTKVSFFMVID